MSNKRLNLDIAMNMIKEDLVRDLSDSVAKTSDNRNNGFKNVSFSHKLKD